MEPSAELIATIQLARNTVKIVGGRNRLIDAPSATRAHHFVKALVGQILCRAHDGSNGSSSTHVRGIVLGWAPP